MLGNGQLVFLLGGVALGYLGYHVIDAMVKGVLGILGHMETTPKVKAPKVEAPAPAPTAPPAPAA